MQRTVRLMLAAAAIAACGSDAAPIGPPTEQSLPGTYRLTSVNGTLPYLIAGDVDRQIRIVSGSFQFRSDHTFTDILTTRLTFTNGDTPIEETSSQSGAFTLLGGNLGVELRYSLPDDVRDTIAVTGVFMHRNDGGLLLTYKK